jgi:hypothetical protein
MVAILPGLSKNISELNDERERFEEQIFELAKQAGMLRDKFGLYWNAHDNHDDGVDLEKFAELLIRQCANVSIDSEIDPNGDFREGIAKSIRQHFGVE